MRGRGGVHEYFLSAGAEIPSVNGKLGPGIDIKSRGGYVLAVGSVGANGGRYEWIDPDVRIAPLTPALLALLRAPTREKRPPSESATTAGAAVETLTEGCRNDGLCRYLGRLRRAGFAPAALVHAAHVFNAEHCQPPMSADEVERTALSVGRYAPPYQRRIRWVSP